MLGKVLATLLLMVGVGIVLGLTNILVLEAVGALLLLIGGAGLALGLLLAVVFAFEGILFRTTNRWDRFN